MQAARDCYAAAGDDGKLAREEEPVVGNLYAVILQQQEMDARWAKLVRIKKLGDLVKLKNGYEKMEKHLVGCEIYLVNNGILNLLLLKLM